MSVINTDKLYELIGSETHRCLGCDAEGDREDFTHSPECPVQVLESLRIKATWFSRYRDRDNYVCENEHTTTDGGYSTPAQFGETVGREVWSHRGEMGSYYGGCSFHIDINEVCPSIAAEVESPVNRVIGEFRKAEDAKVAEAERKARIRSATAAIASLNGLKEELRDEAYAKRMSGLKATYHDVWETVTKNS